MDPLEKEFQYYLDNKRSIISVFPGRFVVIQNQTVVRDFSTELEAYEFGKGRFGLGYFLIQHCTDGADRVVIQSMVLGKV